MTQPTATRLAFADPGEAAALAAFLRRLLRWERAAAVRLQADRGVLGVFARPARFEILAVLTARLLEPVGLDATVSAGELLEGVQESDETVSVPAEVTGPSWAGLLPPRGGWRPLTELPAQRVRETATSVVREFRERTERLPRDQRTQETMDALASEIWDRQLPGTTMPLRAVHAAHALGFLRGPEPVAFFHTEPWLRLRTPHGSVIVRTITSAGSSAGQGLSITPL